MLRFIASRRATVALLVIIGSIAACCSFLPPSQAETVFASNPLVIILSLFFLNILLGLILFFRQDLPRIWIHLIRFGLLIVLLGVFLGRCYGKRGYVQLYEGQQTGEFRGEEGALVAPGFCLRLDRFCVERYPGGEHEIGISAGDNGGLRAYPVTIGRWVGPEELRVLPVRYVPDFKITNGGKIISRSREPNNPALEVAVEAGGGTERGWLFARFPHFPPIGLSRTLRAGRVIFFDRHSENIKSYTSTVSILEGDKQVASGTVKVNHPFRFNGYKIYQSKYDPVGWQWSGFELVRDPGIPFVYCGFIFLALGFTLWIGLGKFD